MYKSIDTSIIMASSDVDSANEVLNDNGKHYDWKMFIPKGCTFHRFKWLFHGASEESKLSRKQVTQNMIKLARMLSLLQEYEERFGIPERGGGRDQQWVMKELCSQLYGSGTPMWVLQPVMSRFAEGLTGTRGVYFVLFPRAVMVYSPVSDNTISFPTERGFNIQTLTLAERILVRVSSFASNARSVHSIQPGSFDPRDLLRASRGSSNRNLGGSELGKEELSKEILDLANDGVGLFFITSERKRMNDPATSKYTILGKMQATLRKDDVEEDLKSMEEFFTVKDSSREIFTRLATLEAAAALEAIPSAPVLYPRPLVILFRVISNVGAAGLWFSGSWFDMIPVAFLTILVALIEGYSIWKHERIIYEVIVSFFVGLVAGLTAIHWPNQMCFQPIAIASVLDLLQGFRIVYSIMQIMSKHTISGGADLIEAIIFTGLIGYFLKFGLSFAEFLLDGADINDKWDVCENPIDTRWHFLIVPITSLSWALLFTPPYQDLPLMTFHGILGYVVYWAVERSSGKTGLATFVAAACATSAASLVSRFTGRQALGDSITGLYVLLPGSYLARGLFTAAENNLIDGNILTNIVVIAVTIGLGGWTGSTLFSPTILGTNQGLLKYFTKVRNDEKRSRDSLNRMSTYGHDKEKTAMLFF